MKGLSRVREIGHEDTLLSSHANCAPDGGLYEK
jgi:hypothetical protein